MSSRLFHALRTFGSAIRASAAAEAGRMPAGRDLKRLGIDPVQYGRIGR